MGKTENGVKGIDKGNKQTRTMLPRMSQETWSGGLLQEEIYILVELDWQNSKFLFVS